MQYIDPVLFIRRDPSQRLVLAASAAALMLGIGLLVTPWLGKNGFIAPEEAVRQAVSLARDTSVWVATLAISALYGVAVVGLDRRYVNLIASAVGLTALFHLGYTVMGRSYARTVQLWEIQTSPADPVPFTEKMLDLRVNAPEPLEHAAILQKKAWPEVKPLVLKADATIVAREVLAVVRAEEMTVVADYRTEGHLEAVARSDWFGLPVDLAFRVREYDDHTQLDMRCAARFALGDPGGCARRILHLQREVTKAVEAFVHIQARIEARKLKTRDQLFGTQP